MEGLALVKNIEHLKTVTMWKKQKMPVLKRKVMIPPTELLCSFICSSAPTTAAVHKNQHNFMDIWVQRSKYSMLMPAWPKIRHKHLFDVYLIYKREYQ